MASTIEDKLNSKLITVYFSEVLDACANKKTRAERIDLLTKFRDKNKDNALIVQKVMECLVHPMVDIDVPEGIPPHKDNQVTAITDYNNAPTSLMKAFSHIPYFVKICKPYILSPQRRELHFIQLIEGMYHRDAVLLCGLKDKKITGFHGVNNQLLIDAYGEKETVGNE